MAEQHSPEERNRLGPLITGILRVLSSIPRRPGSFTGLSTENFAGEYGFELALQELQLIRPETCRYSQILNKLFCEKGMPCPVLMKVSVPPPHNSIVRATAVYKLSEYAAEVVKCCSQEIPPHRKSDVAPSEPLIKVEGNQNARYFSDRETEHHSVTVPYERPEEGSAYTTILYKFMCTNDCIWCMKHRPVLTVITLESQAGRILGRCCFDVWVSFSPKLDRRTEDEKILEEKNVVCENQAELIRCVSKVPEVLNELVGVVLNRTQCEDIMSEPTDALRMQKLFEEVLVGNELHQAHLYRVLLRTNWALIDKLLGGHFVERHQKQLTENVSGMDIILFRLNGSVLNHDEFHLIMTEETDVGKMKKLLELMPGWDGRQKDLLYQELIQTNGPLIAALEALKDNAHPVKVYRRLSSDNSTDSLFQPDEPKMAACSSKVLRTFEPVRASEAARFAASSNPEEHFVEKHQEELIRRVVGVDVVVEFLEIHSVITFHQMQAIKGTDQEQMQKLYELMPGWRTSGKDRLQEILKKTNRRLIGQLAGGHFVDRHQEELIERVTKVPLSLLREFALDEEEYEILLNCTTVKMQMSALFQMKQEWDRQQKDWLYRALAETNPDVIKVLEEEHFIEKHQEEVIHRACRVNTVLQWLHDQHSLIREESDQKKMFQLYTLVPRWNRKQKDHLYTVLKKTNGPLIAELEEGHFVERHKEYLMKNIIGIRKVAHFLMERCTISHYSYGDILRKDTNKEIMEMLYEVVPSWKVEQKNYFYRILWNTNETLIEELESRKSRKDGLIPNCLAEKCCLCEKEKDFLEVQPEFVPDAEEKLKTYRIHLPKAGTFLCSVTELKFEVKAAVTLEYAFRSWDQHLSKAVMQTWMVAGPLFDIRADAEEKVAAVHLPHFLCLGGRKTDESQMKIAHFTDVGMTLEKPVQVTPFHAVLENPKFSLLGVLIKPIYDKLFRVHAVVLLYQAYKRITALNLYLIPNDSSLIQAIKDEEEKFHSVLVRKPPQTKKSLHYGSFYTVFSSADLQISPQELEFTYKNPRQLQSFVEVRIRNTERVHLSMKKKKKDFSVWDTLLEPGPQEEPHFIDKHRAELIQRTSTVEGVLDLLHGTILDDEQYERIASRETNQDKMRELYKLVPSWDRSCKDRLYEALKAKNKFLVQDLEGR
ncbi:uncharacterized protein LOC129338333 isoform X2 [Eublepharis macularius]|uniref:Cellular tumor antigen p53 n=1 Tax=Eublepharis macularius TaxID=481883 RepID=A0AA97K4L5_EUBMA|nr:uncharacterized protein LOC129338333 isoform X2 [Eublepharis macularius]